MTMLPKRHDKKIEFLRDSFTFILPLVFPIWALLFSETCVRTTSWDSRLLPSRLAPAAPSVGAKPRPCAPSCPDLSGAAVYKTATYHCTARTTLGSFSGAGKKKHVLFINTAIEQRYGCANRTRINLYYLCETIHVGV